jgi:predicted O-methyltransferase YrrM
MSVSESPRSTGTARPTAEAGRDRLRRPPVNSRPLDFDAVAAAVEGVPVMSKAEGRRVYDHLRATGARDALEIGTAHGVSAAYIAAALGANGGGGLTTVDHINSPKDPPASAILERAGVQHLVRRVLVEDSSYTWWLKGQVEANSDDAGNCQPLYDFCYLDGAHNWTIDGFSVVLIEKLLRPGAWLLLDDLAWTYSGSVTGEGQGAKDLRLSKAEQVSPHVKAVFDLIVRQHPSFTEFRVEDDWWGWARKAPGEPRRYEVRTTVSPGAAITRGLRKLMGRS